MAATAIAAGLPALEAAGLPRGAFTQELELPSVAIRRKERIERLIKEINSIAKDLAVSAGVVPRATGHLGGGGGGRGHQPPFQERKVASGILNNWVFRLKETGGAAGHGDGVGGGDGAWQVSGASANTDPLIPSTMVGELQSYVCDMLERASGCAPGGGGEETKRAALQVMEKCKKAAQHVEKYAKQQTALYRRRLGSPLVNDRNLGVRLLHPGMEKEGFRGEIDEVAIEWRPAINDAPRSASVKKTSQGRTVERAVILLFKNKYDALCDLYRRHTGDDGLMLSRIFCMATPRSDTG